MAWDNAVDETSGLRDDFDGVVVNSYFGTDSRYGGGEILVLKWEIQGLDEEGVAFEDTSLITIGKGWEKSDPEGYAVKRINGGDKGFHQSGHLGMILKRCLADFGMLSLLSSRGSERDAAIWTGLAFHFKREKQTYSGGGKGDGTVPASAEKLMPVAFLGTEGIEGVAVSASNGTTAAAASSAAPTQDQLRAAVEQVLAENENFGEYGTKVLEIPGLLNDRALLMEVTSRDFFDANKSPVG